MKKLFMTLMVFTILASTQHTSSSASIAHVISPALITYAKEPLPPNTSRASEAVFTVYPAHVHANNRSWIIKNVRPGQSYEESIVIKNLSAEPIELKIEIKTAKGDDENFRIIEKPDIEKSDIEKSDIAKTTYDLTAQNITAWLSTSADTLTLKPYEKKNIAIKMVIPENLENEANSANPNNTVTHQYKASILVSHHREDQNLNVITRLGTRIYLNIDPNADLEINLFNTHLTLPQFALLIISGMGIVLGLILNRKKSCTK